MNITTANKKKPRLTRSVARFERAKAFSETFSVVLSVLTRDGWVEATDLVTLERTCRSAKHDWCTEKDVWKPLALRTWPCVDLDLILATFGGGSSYKTLFANPRAWLEAEVSKVKSLPKWSQVLHYNVECGRCGCNCNNGSLCPGIPIETEHRWEKIEQVGWPENRVDVKPGEGYYMSGKTMIAINRFCEPCFERLVEIGTLQRSDYEQVRGTCVYDEVTKHILNETGRFDKRSFTPTFFDTSEDSSWQDTHGNKVEADDLAIVIAHALVQPGCNYQHLDVQAIHFNDPGFGERGYKALAFALAINTSIKSIVFRYDECCYVPHDYELPDDADKSHGYFLKALQHNKRSSLERLILCPNAFGYKTIRLLVKAKTNLRAF